MTISNALWWIGGIIFCSLGAIHAIYTVGDTFSPRWLVPDDSTMIEAMKGSGVRLARTGTNMWRAWIGFNFSHSLGVVLFGIACTHWGDLLGLSDGALAQVGRFVPTLVGATYFVLAVRYWFRVPVIGIALGTLSLFVAGILG